MALLVSGAAAGVWWALRPALDHSALAVSVLAVLASALLGGAGSVVAAAMLLTGAGVWADMVAGAGTAELALHAAALLTAGLTLAAWMAQVRMRTEAAAQRLDRMSAGLSRDLNQPLSALTNYLRAARTMIARLELRDDTLIEAVGRAGDQALRAGEVAAQLRTLAQPSGRVAPGEPPYTTSSQP